ncbi:hypothetical protein CRG98_029144 [Punica granatum]|uniref:Uncharacterized protein n=1 Tax=Punica granatum TaxID=22663 RepID=A0A2I0J2K0_PUNGR|nr:hypothetical protein CRG98_029144 [Punica granatum]
MTFVAGGLGHALSVGAFGCDLCGGRVGTQFHEARQEFGTGLSELPLRLWLADEFFIFLSSLPAKVCRSWFAEARWDPRVLMDFVEAQTRGRV